MDWTDKQTLKSIADSLAIIAAVLTEHVKIGGALNLQDAARVLAAARKDQ